MQFQKLTKSLFDMYAQTLELENNRKHRRKSAWLTLLFLGAMGALIAYPLFQHFMETPDEERYEAVLTVDFTDFGKASKKPAEEGAAGGKELPEKKVEEPTPEVKPLPAKAPVVKTPEPNPPVRTAPKVPDVPKRAKTKPTVKQPKDATPVPAKPKVRVSEPPKPDTKPTKVGNGSGTAAGSQGSGKASEGSNGDDATPGDGDDGMDFSGNGIFGRKVTYRADVKKITKKKGTVVVNLCVDRAGRVVYTAENKALTTMKDRSVVEKAVALTRKYRFEKDWNAPAKECGKLTYIFDLEQ